MARAFGITCRALLASMSLVSTPFGQAAQYRGDSASGLVAQFESTAIFWKQFDVAKKIIALKDKSVLQALEPWLSNDDMCRRGNAAFIFASLGDDRGFEVIKAILQDRSTRRAVFEIGSIGGPNVELQIRQDRYYAVHLFGDLKDARAVPILVPLLKDQDVNYIVPWALGQIGDKSAIPALIEALDDKDPNVRVGAVRALEQLDAKEALPKLHALLEDAFTYFDLSIPLASAAQKAMDKLDQKPGQTMTKRP